MQPIDDELKTKLLGETARLGWPELQRHFARGVVVVVAPELDLIEAAARISLDDGDTIGAWLAADKLHRASEEDARRWNATDAMFWAVVVAPWVLVQALPEKHDT